MLAGLMSRCTTRLVRVTDGGADSLKQGEAFAGGHPVITIIISDRLVLQHTPSPDRQLHPGNASVQQARDIGIFEAANICCSLEKRRSRSGEYTAAGILKVEKES
jgi:hypothetical protein